ncbi:MAG: hypothetical protein RML94_16350, partial [Bacteroidia bacterium]|nr:hypothetical protein [Bacteroidia bacterium]
RRVRQQCVAPRTPVFNPLSRGWAGGGEAPSARSTPTLPTRAQRDVGKDTPKNKSHSIITNAPQ